jgi:preprotein translocase subunit SecG
MSEALEKLKDIGAQKIYEDTHIPVEYVQTILYESFDGMNKIQFVGFISILEREYGEDLSAIRARGVSYFDEKSTPDEAIMDDAIFKKSSPKKKNLTIIYIVLVIILFIISIFYTTQSANESMQSAIQENEIIKDAKKNILADANSSDENVTTLNDDLNETAVKTSEPKAVVHSFKIIARTEVWLGYIDVATDKKYQKTFEGEFDLDPTKEWLLYFGHGYIDVITDGKKESFNSKNTLRLHYQEGNISEISINEFRKLNRGNTW